jgi:hypothetical protein
MIAGIAAVYDALMPPGTGRTSSTAGDVLGPRVLLGGWLTGYATAPRALLVNGLPGEALLLSIGLAGYLALVAT